jgi:hypothetical protein
VFRIFGFFYDFIWNLQALGKNTKGGKNLIFLRPLETFDFHNSTLSSNKPVPESKNSHKHAPGGGGELAAGDVGPKLANK